MLHNFPIILPVESFKVKMLPHYTICVLPMAFMMMFSSALSSPNSLKLEHQAFWERSLSMSTSHVKDRHIAIDMVTVGDLGNENDPLTGNLFGAVDYKYQIGKYDVTIQQYTQFLNSVAASDPYERRIKLSLAFCSLVPRDLTPTVWLDLRAKILPVRAVLEIVRSLM
jgi:hypothetical protein